MGCNRVSCSPRPLNGPSSSATAARDRGSGSAVVDLNQVLSSLAQVSEQAKRSLSASRMPRSVGDGQTMADSALVGGIALRPPSVQPSAVQVPAAKLQQYKQQLHLLQDTLLQSAQSALMSGCRGWE